MFHALIRRSRSKRMVCTSGVYLRDAALFADMNAYVVSAFDGSMEMVKLTKARSAKVSVKQATFDDFTNAAHADVYDGKKSRRRDRRRRCETRGGHARLIVFILTLRRS